MAPIRLSRPIPRATDCPGYVVDPVTVSYSDGGGPISLGTFTPSSDNWTQVRSIWFDPTDTSGTLTFSVAPYSGDADIGIDAIGLAVPEPMTWIMMIMGVGMIGAGLRYNRRNGVAATA